MSIFVLFHFTFHLLSSIAYHQLELMEVLLRYIGIYSMIYFVFIKASKPLKNKREWINYGIRPAVIISFLANSSEVIFL